MASKNKGNERDRPKQQKWLCSKCGHKLADLLNESAVIFYREGREFYITYDVMGTNCPKCDFPQEKESPLLDSAIREIAKKIFYKTTTVGDLEIQSTSTRVELIMSIRLKAWGVKNFKDFVRTFPSENIRMPNKERSRFIASLTVNERKAYKVMCDTFKGFINDPEIGLINDPETMDAIKKRLQLPSLKEAERLYIIVLEKLREFKREYAERVMHS